MYYLYGTCTQNTMEGFILLQYFEVYSLYILYLRSSFGDKWEVSNRWVNLYGTCAQNTMEGFILLWSRLLSIYIIYGIYLIWGRIWFFFFDMGPKNHGLLIQTSILWYGVILEFICLIWWGHVFRPFIRYGVKKVKKVILFEMGLNGFFFVDMGSESFCHLIWAYYIWYGVGAFETNMHFLDSMGINIFDMGSVLSKLLRYGVSLVPIASIWCQYLWYGVSLVYPILYLWSSFRDKWEVSNRWVNLYGTCTQNTMEGFILLWSLLSIYIIFVEFI